jgi:hypothetical protein
MVAQKIKSLAEEVLKSSEPNETTTIQQRTEST